MNRVITSRFGEVEYAQEDLILFENGLPGFETEKEFIIIHPDQEMELAFLQSVHHGELAFIIANPFLFFKDYVFELNEEEKETLKIQSEEDVAVWGIIAVQDDFRKATMNLKAPIVINAKERKGKQVILYDSDYLTKTPLFPQPMAKGGE